MVNKNDLSEEMNEALKEWKTKQKYVVQEIKETLGEIKKTENEKDVVFGGATVVPVIPVSTILKDTCYLVAVAVTGALGFWLSKMFGQIVS